MDVTCTTSPAGDVLLDFVLDVLVLSGWCVASDGLCTPGLPVLRGEHVRQSDGLPTRFSEGWDGPAMGIMKFRDGFTTHWGASLCSPRPLSSSSSLLSSKDGRMSPRVVEERPLGGGWREGSRERERERDIFPAPPRPVDTYEKVTSVHTRRMNGKKRVGERSEWRMWGNIGEKGNVRSALPSWPPCLWCIDAQVEVRPRQQQQPLWIGNERSQRLRGRWWWSPGGLVSLSSLDK
jgi:hypothetical protein